MKQPTRQQTIALRVWRTDGLKVIEDIVGYNDYPLAIHRPVAECEEIQLGRRNRYSGIWCVSHIPTGKGFGIRCRDWNAVVGYVDKIKDHPVLLMITDKTMTGHPMYRDLVDLHRDMKSLLPND